MFAQSAMFAEPHFRGIYVHYLHLGRYLHLKWESVKARKVK